MEELNGILDNSIKDRRRLNKMSSGKLETNDLSQGNIIAAVYLKDSSFDLLAEVSRYDINIRTYITRDILETLVKNISIPRDSEIQGYSRRSILGILSLTGDQVSVKRVIDEIDGLFADYEAALQQAYIQLRNEFGAEMDESRKVLEQQLGARVEFNIERQSRFRNKWRKMRAELNTYYEKILQNYKQQLLN